MCTNIKINTSIIDDNGNTIPIHRFNFAIKYVATIEYVINDNKRNSIVFGTDAVFNTKYPTIKESIIEIINAQSEIDLIINRNLENYTLSRINYVDKAIIRLATYELKLAKNPHNIIIDEALELTKEYSNLDDGLQAKFNNRILDKIYQDLSNDK